VLNARWDVYAKLRLKDLAEYFEKCPMLKGSTMRFLINTNQVSASFSVARGAGVPTYATPSVLGGNTCPLHLGFRPAETTTAVGGAGLNAEIMSFLLILLNLGKTLLNNLLLLRAVYTLLYIVLTLWRNNATYLYRQLKK
jgi:hypothetical protein